MRILFICKANETYGFRNYCRKSSGLFNSTYFVAHALSQAGIHARVVEVTDNNDIDREVTHFRPHVCVIEALWVVPEKFEVLKRLHPKVSWFVHLHSHIAFLAQEGIAVRWLREYVTRSVGIIANSKDSYEALLAFLPPDSLTLLHNIYSAEIHPPVPQKDTPVLKIGCYGAVRPMKNQLTQALAALEFARELGKKLHFHINATRIETGGAPVLSNLVALFEGQPDAKLYPEVWHEASAFRHHLRSLDLGMQLSLAETFNIVSADYVAAGLPVVVSKQVPWVSRWSQSSVDDISDILCVMRRAYSRRMLIRLNQWYLGNSAEEALCEWLSFCRSFT